MSLFDSLGITVMFFLFLIVSIVALYMWATVSPSIPDSGNNNITSTFNNSINTSVAFWNQDFAVIYMILMLGSVLLTIFLNSNPALLVIWLLLNVAIVFVWDQLNTVLNLFVNSDINGGQLDQAVDFFQGPMGKVIPIINCLIGIFLFGKKAVL